MESVSLYVVIKTFTTQYLQPLREKNLPHKGSSQFAGARLRLTSADQKKKTHNPTPRILLTSCSLTVRKKTK